MSFPWLMVKVERHRSVSLRYQNELGEYKEMNNVDQALSELLQHEIDHLDGILAIDRAQDRNSIISRDVYQLRKKEFDTQVDYTIIPTIVAE
jgi:peptide deformylase